MQRIQIAPGAFVTTLPGEKFKRCKVAVRLVLPGQRESATALALLPNLLDRQCEAIPDPLQLSRRLFALYGAEIASESFVVGANRVVTIGIQGLKNAYALQGEDLESAYVDLACQLLFHPKLSGGVFEPEDVAIEKEKQADYLRSEMNEKRTYCIQQARRKLYGASPLGLENGGYLEDIDGITPASLYEVYRDLLRRAQVEVTVFGMGGEVAAQRIVQELAGLERQPVTPLPAEAAEGDAAFPHFEEPMDTVQGKLCILCTSPRVPDARGAAVMRVAGAVFGGLPTSRLFMNVREKQSLCYYCATGYNGFTGVMTIDSGVEHKNLQKAADAILHELHTLQTELISEEEMQYAQKAIAGAFTTAQDSPVSMESWAFTETMRGTQLTMAEFAAMVQSVTREEVREALAALVPALQYAIIGKGETT